MTVVTYWNQQDSFGITKRFRDPVAINGNNFQWFKGLIKYFSESFVDSSVIVDGQLVDSFRSTKDFSDRYLDG